jgi:hypothetical protein
MREDQLSPLLGRLIDAAKAAVPQTGDRAGHPSEAVALLTDSGAIYTGRSGGGPAGAACGAAEAALDDWRRAGTGSIDAAALAGDPACESVFPCAECGRLLAGIDPELPLVLKQRGRWVLAPLSAVRGAS